MRTPKGEGTWCFGFGTVVGFVVFFAALAFMWVAGVSDILDTLENDRPSAVSIVWGVAQCFFGSAVAAFAGWLAFFCVGGGLYLLFER